MKELLSPKEIRNNQVLRDLYDESTLPYSSVRRKAEINRRHRAIARWIKSQAKRDADAAFLRKRRRAKEYQMDRLLKSRVTKGLDGEPISYTFLQIYLAERAALAIDTNGWSELVRKYGARNVVTFEEYKSLGFFDLYDPKIHILSRADAKGPWLVPNIVLKERPPLHANHKRISPKAIKYAKVVYRPEDATRPGAPLHGAGDDGGYTG